MTATEWVPLSHRRAGLGPLPPVEGAPLYLMKVLQRWLLRRLRSEHDLHNELRLRLRTGADLWSQEGDALLDVLDAYLYWHPDCIWDDGEDDGIEVSPEQDAELQAEIDEWKHIAGEIEQILSAGGSTWRVNRKFNGLERRVDDTVTAAVGMAEKTTSAEASDHLATAWRAAYGRDPDPDKAYDEAVLAVEALSCPLVCPNNKRRSLGTVIADLTNQKAQWELAIGDSTGQPAGVDRLIEMLALLWQGQSRHAGSPNSRRQTQTEGEAAVHLAATLVQWLTSGVLRRKP